MKAQDIQLGQRVLVSTTGRPALVVGQPEAYTSNAKIVRIKYEQSTRFESVLDHQIDLLPASEQYPAFGGTHERTGGVIS